MESKIILGMMSGTSVDGIDASLVKFNSASDLEVLDTYFAPFSEPLRNQINKIAQSKSIESCSETSLHQQLAYRYAEAAELLISQSGINRSSINAIANHGQTVRHEPNADPGYSLQLGDAQIIADQTKMLTIGNFRQADLSSGGQGAPLMPAFHSAIFGGSDRFLLNIGGIANVTHLGETVIGFDTGPGNTLMDQWINACQKKPYDHNGDWAASGKCNAELLNRLISDPYFSLGFPKSTGPDYFNLNWLGDVSDIPEEDVQATLLELTALTISGEISQLGAISGEIFICGGGAKNSILVQRIKNLLPNFSLENTDALGVPADWVESVGFAWLGYCRLTNRFSSLPSVTGADEAQVLGEVFFPADD